MLHRNKSFLLLLKIHLTLKGGGGAGASPNISKEVESGIDPLQMAVLKAVQKTVGEQASEAIQMGVPPEQVLGQAGVPTFAGARAMESANKQPQKAQQSQQQSNVTINNPQGILKNLFQQAGVSTDENGNIVVNQGGAFSVRARNQLPNAESLQRLTGQVPLQKGEKESIEIQEFNKLLTGSNKPLSSDASKSLGNLKSGLNQVNSLIAEFESDPNLFKALNPLGERRQIVKTMLGDLTDVLGRLRSGGAINDEEFKAFKRQLPSLGLAGKIEKASTVKFKLNKLKSLFSDIKSAVAPNEGSDVSQRMQSAIAAGFSREEIIQRLKSRGNF